MEHVHTFPVNQQGFQAHALCQAATDACHLTHGIDLDSQENVFANPRSTLESAQTPYRGIHQFATSSAADKHKETCGKRGRTNWKRNPNADICKKAADHERLKASGYSTEVLWVDSKDSRYRNFNLIKALLRHHFNVG